MGNMRYVIAFVGDPDNHVEILPNQRFRTLSQAHEKMAEIDIHARTLRIINAQCVVRKLQIVEIPETQREAS